MIRPKAAPIASKTKVLPAGRASVPNGGGAALPRRASVAAAAPPTVLPADKALLIIRWNWAMAVFHLLLAAVTLGVGNRELAVPVYKTVVDFQVPVNGTWSLVPYQRESGSLMVTALVAVFFLLSSAFHLLNATLWRRFYLAELARCRSPTRWTEYFFSAPVMIVLIGYSLGIRDRASIIAIAALVATTMPFGYWTEMIARPTQTADAWTEPLSVRLFPWVVGHVPQTFAWLIIVLQFYDGDFDPSEKAPSFVHVILWGELVLFFSFGFAALAAQLGTPKQFYRGEIAFQVLSLVSKGLLGILLIANVLMLSRFEEIYENDAPR